ncbi:MAG: acetyltransferase [Methylococcaceae bacterium]|nr:MAG: acetyltransferase [Methylococcaceae bacterium]
MTDNVVIFGNGKIASLVWYCLSHDSPWCVKGFAVDRAYLKDAVHEGLPVVAFEDLPSLYPPAEVRLIIPLGYTHINGLRRERYMQAKALGYGFASYVSKRASIWPDLQIGENCLIYEQAIIQPFARLGDNVIVRSGAYISHHCVLGSHTFVGGRATLGGYVHTGEQAVIGLSAVIRPGIHLAERSFAGVGAVVVANTEPDAVYLGNPARKITKSAMEATC